MASVGSVSADFVKGEAPPLLERSEAWHYPGLDGQGIQLLGLAADAFVFSAVKFGTNAQCDTFITAVEALVGTVVTITNDFSTAFANCFVQKISTPRKSAAVASGRDTKCVIEVRGIVTA